MNFPQTQRDASSLAGWFFLVFCIFCYSAPAFGETDKAAKYYERARTAYKNDQLETAVEYLEKAYAEEENIIYQYNRVMALQGLEKYRKALRVLKKYETRMRTDERFQDLPKIKRELEIRIRQLNDAQKAANTIAEQRLQTASWAFVKSKSAKVANVRKALLDKIAARKVASYTDITARQLAQSSISVKTDAYQDSGGPKVLGWSLATIGGLSLIGSLLLNQGVFMPSGVTEGHECLENQPSDLSDSRRINNCYGSPSKTLDEAVSDFKDDRKIWNTQSNYWKILMGVGIGATVGGTVTLVFFTDTFGVGGGAKDSTPSGPSADPKVSVTPMLAPETAGAMLNITF